MKKFEFYFIVQYKTVIAKRKYTVTAKSFNDALYFGDGNVTGKLEMNDKVISYALLSYKEYDDDGNLIESKKVNDESDFIPR